MRVESLRLSLLPARLTQNATERQRQGTLAQAAKERSKLATCSLDGAGDDGPFETVDLGSTAAIYDAVSELHWRARLDRWMVNEGGARMIRSGSHPPRSGLTGLLYALSQALASSRTLSGFFSTCSSSPLASFTTA